MPEPAWVERVMRQLALDCACESEDLDRDGTTFVEACPREGRRRFPWRARSLELVTFGRGVVVSADAGRLTWAREQLGGLERDALFAPPTVGRLQARVAADGQSMDGPVLKLSCAPGSLQAAMSPAGVRCESYGPERVEELRAHEVGSVLGRDPARPDLRVCVARERDRVVGMAAISADSDELWQVGLAVEPEARARGVAQAMVCELTAHALDRDRVPYYSVYPANLASINVALAVGYRPVWIELGTR